MARRSLRSVIKGSRISFHPVSMYIPISANIPSRFCHSGERLLLHSSWNFTMQYAKNGMMTVCHTLVTTSRMLLNNWTKPSTSGWPYCAHTAVIDPMASIHTSRRTSRAGSTTP